MSYYTMINFLAVSIFIILLIMVSSNGKFNKRARKGLKFAFLLGILGIAGEWVGYILQIELVNYKRMQSIVILSLIHISEPTRLGKISYADFSLKK